LRPDPPGGSIEASANDGAEQMSRDQSREHPASIAKAFAAGDFGKAEATHAAVPPGVKTMKSRLKTLTFRYEDLPAGGRVVITAASAKTTAAVHAFLRYQIREHGTGDGITVSR